LSELTFAATVICSIRREPDHSENLSKLTFADARFHFKRKFERADARCYGYLIINSLAAKRSAGIWASSRKGKMERADARCYGYLIINSLAAKRSAGVLGILTEGKDGAG